MLPLFSVIEDVALNDGSVFADFDVSALFSLLRFGIALVGQEQPQTLSLVSHRGFPGENVEDNHVAGIVHESLQGENVVPANDGRIRTHT